MRNGVLFQISIRPILPCATLSKLEGWAFIKEFKVGIIELFVSSMKFSEIAFWWTFFEASFVKFGDDVCVWHNFYQVKYGSPPLIFQYNHPFVEIFLSGVVTSEPSPLVIIWF
jgi:hypothetical protein